MVAVLNRTTKDFLPTVHTPDYPTADYVHDPNMTPVAGLEKRDWKLVGDTPTVLTDAEWDAANLNAYKAERHAEVDLRTLQLISAGFLYDSKTFSLSTNAQTNWQALQSAGDASRLTFPVAVSTKDGGEYTISDLATLTAFTTTALGTAKTHYDSGRALRLQITAAATKSAVDAVEDNR